MYRFSQLICTLQHTRWAAFITDTAIVNAAALHDASEAREEIRGLEFHQFHHDHCVVMFMGIASKGMICCASCRESLDHTQQHSQWDCAYRAIPSVRFSKFMPLCSRCVSHFIYRNSDLPGSQAISCLGVLTRPILCRLYCAWFIYFPLLSYIICKRIVWIRRSEQCLYREENGANLQRGGPITYAVRQ